MSKEIVQLIIGRAVTDLAFRELLFISPEKALEGYTLTEEEASLITGMERERLETVAGELEERISRAGLSAGDFVDITKVGKELNFDLGGSIMKSYLCPPPTLTLASC